MPTRRPVKRTRCVACRDLVETTVLGRCPKCMSVEAGATRDWRLDACMTRGFVRSDGRQLACVVMRSGEYWLVMAVETLQSNGEGARYLIGRPQTMIAAVGMAEAFGRRWLEDCRVQPSEKPS